MAYLQLSSLWHLRKLVRRRGSGDSSDGQLLDAFVERQDQDAFAQLLERHGPLVLGVCRRVVKDLHLSEDAFQATFLVLARKAGSIGAGVALGSWLYRVAFRAALKTKMRMLKQPLQASEACDMATEETMADSGLNELRPLLDEALDGLPEKHRAPIVLCYLQGKTRAEVAQVLGCTESTIKGRLELGKEMLRKRLQRRGLTVSAAALATGLTQQAVSAAVPAPLMFGTLKAATMGVVADTQAVPAVTASATVIAQGVLKDMFIYKMKVAIAALLIIAGVGSAGTGAVLLVQEGFSTSSPSPAQAIAEADPEPPPKDKAEPQSKKEVQKLPNEDANKPLVEELDPSPVTLKDKKSIDEWHCHVSLRSCAGLAGESSFHVRSVAHGERLHQLRDPTYS